MKSKLKQVLFLGLLIPALMPGDGLAAPSRPTSRPQAYGEVRNLTPGLQLNYRVSHNTKVRIDSATNTLVSVESRTNDFTVSVTGNSDREGTRLELEVGHSVFEVERNGRKVRWDTRESKPADPRARLQQALIGQRFRLQAISNRWISRVDGVAKANEALKKITEQYQLKAFSPLRPNAVAAWLPTLVGLPPARQPAETSWEEQQTLRRWHVPMRVVVWDHRLTAPGKVESQASILSPTPATFVNASITGSTEFDDSKQVVSNSKRTEKFTGVRIQPDGSILTNRTEIVWRYELLDARPLPADFEIKFARTPEPSTEPNQAARAERAARFSWMRTNQRLIKQRRIIDVHEHIASADLAPIYLFAMDRLGIRKMCLMGSSKFTMTLNEKDGYTGFDSNNEELLKIIRQHPERFEAWPTIDPRDPDKLRKFQDYVKRGATGLKLYVGHGYLTKERKYMFHTSALDDAELLPLYRFCQENFLPVMMHLNPYDNGSAKGKPGFAQEFVAVLTQFPDLKVICPHFMLSSVRSERLREFLDTFPNLYTDIGFGDSFMGARIRYLASDREKYRQLFADYPDRFMFAMDLVLTQHPRKNPSWVTAQGEAYLKLLTQEKFKSPVVQDRWLNGLNLSDELLDRILFKNYEAMRASKPDGTRITRRFDWEKTGIRRSQRKPGEWLPPRPLKSDQVGKPAPTSG